MHRPGGTSEGRGCGPILDVSSGRASRTSDRLYRGDERETGVKDDLGFWPEHLEGRRGHRLRWGRCTLWGKEGFFGRGISVLDRQGLRCLSDAQVEICNRLLDT